MQQIKGVSPKPNRASNGTSFYVNGVLDDGGDFSVYAKTEEDGQKIIDQLTPMIGKPLSGGWTIEPAMNKDTGKQREYQGRLKWDLKPPRPAGGGGGGFRGGGGYKESYAQSKESHDATQASIQRQSALKGAIEVSIAQKLFSPETILETAQKFLNFLTCQHTPVAGTATTGQSSKPAAPIGDLDFSQFQGTLKAVNQHRKEAGKPVANLDTMREACLFRGWPDGFNSSGEMQTALGPERFRKLTKEMDKNPLKFEQEEIVSVGGD